jgi:peroxiredoxin
MSIRRQWAIVLVVVALLGGGLVAATRFLGGELYPVTVGSKAPDFRAVTIDPPQQERTLDDYEGKVVLLNIWATWCVPCRAEMPSLERLHRRFARHGLAVVAVSIDEHPNAAVLIREFRDEYGLTFDILHDPTPAIRQAYQTAGVPETFVIGSDGVIRRRVFAAADWDSPANRALVGQLLGVEDAAELTSRR